MWTSYWIELEEMARTTSGIKNITAKRSDLAPDNLLLVHPNCATVGQTLDLVNET